MVSIKSYSKKWKNISTLGATYIMTSCHVTYLINWECFSPVTVTCIVDYSGTWVWIVNYMLKVMWISTSQLQTPTHIHRPIAQFVCLPYSSIWTGRPKFCPFVLIGSCNKYIAICPLILFASCILCSRYLYRLSEFYYISGRNNSWSRIMIRPLNFNCRITRYEHDVTLVQLQVEVQLTWRHVHNALFCRIILISSGWSYY